MPEHDNPGNGGADRLLTLDEAAGLLRVEPPKKLRDHWRKWGLTAYYVGRELRFREAEIWTWLDRNRAA